MLREIERSFHLHLPYISSVRYGDTYRYRRYAHVAIPLFDWDDFILMHVAGLEHGNEQQACVYRAS